MKTKVGVVSLGCDKNRVDTEVMLANLVNGGYEITSSPADADVIIVNTCAFLETARREAIETALEMAGYKKNGICKKVIITGCLGQKFGDEVYSELAEVDAVIGTEQYDSICQIVESTLAGERKLINDCSEGSIAFGSRILTTAPHTAYLKIADGCDNYCTYCLIPFIRGRYRSVPIGKVVEQARELATQGVKEMILVAQDTTRYGKDLYSEYKLVDLLRQISAIEGVEWIRLLYCYPELVTGDLQEEIISNPKIVNYLDIPLQHVNDEMLRRMNRRSNRKSIVELFDRLARNNIAVRSTFICGFPYETKQTVQEVEEFLRKYKLRNVGFFPYSREEGTSAAKLDKQVAERTKQAYVKKLYATQYKIAQGLNQSEIGKKYKCIIDCYNERSSDDYFIYIGRTYFMSPEIDGIVQIVSKHQLQVGSFCDVVITGTYEYDLLGEVVE